MRLVFASLFLVLATAAHAEVYECDDGSGHKSFSQQPCGSNAQVVPLQGDTGGSITLNTDTSADSLLAACKLMMRGVTVASNLARENININTAQQRVFGFIRDHISNYREATRQNPGLGSFINQNAALVTVLGYQSVGRGITDEDLDNATAACAKSAYQAAQQAGQLQGGTHRTGDKMM